MDKPRNRGRKAVLTAAMICALCAPAWGGPKKPQPARHDGKLALAASYAPAHVNGQTWYRGYEAARFKNQRLGKKARPILLLRILGDLDGKT